ncbi:hypothetical protein Btru_019803 [Bulinus truncatus]|nr:hypothetical protein Btru_019803 [Bulinus truncatus]
MSVISKSSSLTSLSVAGEEDDHVEDVNQSDDELSPHDQDGLTESDEQTQSYVQLGGSHQTPAPLEHFKLMYAFSNHSPQDILVQEGTGYFPAKVLKRAPGCMNLQEFKDTIFKILGTAEYDEYLEKLFIKQEQTTKVVAVQSPVRYVTISKEGAMSVWQPNMAMEKHYTISDLEDEQGSQKRRFKMWVTDAVYMPNCQKIAIASTSRDIRFYDVSSSQYFEEYHLFGNVMSFICNPTVSPPGVCLNTGSIHVLTFHNPVNQLFENPFKNDGGVQKIFMQDVSNHSQWVSHKVLSDLHPRADKAGPESTYRTMKPSSCARVPRETLWSSVTSPPSRSHTSSNWRRYVEKSKKVGGWGGVWGRGGEGGDS